MKAERIPLFDVTINNFSAIISFCRFQISAISLKCVVSRQLRVKTVLWPVLSYESYPINTLTIKCWCFSFATVAWTQTNQGPVSREPRKLFVPEKPFLVNRYLNTERCILLKLVVRNGTAVLRICEQNSSVIIRFEILPRLSGCENFWGLSRNGPQVP